MGRLTDLDLTIERMEKPDYDIDVLSEDVKLRPEDLKPVLEMASSLADYNAHLMGYAFRLYQHLILVVALGNKMPGYVEHWKDEITNFSSPAITTVLKKSSKNADRAKLIRKYMMQPQMGANFEDYSEDSFRTTLELEISKGKKMLSDSAYKINWASINMSVKIMENMLNNLGNIAELCRPELENFYNKFCEAAEEVTPASSQKAIDMLNDAIEQLKPVIPA